MNYTYCILNIKYGYKIMLNINIIFKLRFTGDHFVSFNI